MEPSISTIKDLHRTHAVEVQRETLQIGDIVCHYGYYFWIHEKTEVGDTTQFTGSATNQVDPWFSFWRISFSFGKIEKICSVDETGRITI